MQEIIFKVLGSIRSALRFRWYGMGAAWGVCMLGWGVVIWLPDVYEGSARFYVDTSSVLEPVLRDQIINQDVDAHIAYVRETLLGRDQLQHVISTVGLDEKLSSPEDWELALVALRSEIDIQTAAPTWNTSDRIYSISYRNSDQDKSVGVVQTLLDSFTEDTVGATQSGGETAERFLDERVKEYEDRLQESERALADFKRQNADRLPGAEGDYFSRMQAERDRLTTARRDLRVLEAKRAQLLEQLESQSSVVASDTDAFAEELPANSLDARIRDLQARLDAYLLEYTERHPDVISAREQLEQLTARRDQRLQELGLDVTDQELLGLGANPVHQALQISLNETEVEIATLQTEIADQEQSVARLQGLINELPEVEAQLARLNRDYDVVYDQYLEIVRTREAQDLTRKATDTDQIDVRIIDPPLSSFLPVGPPRVILMTGVFIGAFLLGAGLCYVLAELRPVFGSARTLSAITELPVLGHVSEAWDDRRRLEVGQAVTRFFGAFFALSALFVCVVGFEIVGPGLHSIVFPS